MKFEYADDGMIHENWKNGIEAYLSIGEDSLSAELRRDLYRCPCGQYLQDGLIALEGKCPFCDRDIPADVVERARDKRQADYYERAEQEEEKQKKDTSHE